MTPDIVEVDGVLHTRLNIIRGIINTRITPTITNRNIKRYLNELENAGIVNTGKFHKQNLYVSNISRSKLVRYIKTYEPVDPETMLLIERCVRETQKGKIIIENYE